MGRPTVRLTLLSGDISHVSAPHWPLGLCLEAQLTSMLPQTGDPACVVPTRANFWAHESVRTTP